MSAQLTPAKRAYERGPSEANGKGKWQKSAHYNSSNTPWKTSTGNTVFRLLCPAAKTGSVIGKGGNIISQIRQETGAKVRVEETVAGCDERIIFIAGSDKEKGNVNEQSKDNDEETKVTEGGGNADEHGEDDADKKSALLEDFPSDKVNSSVQKALLLVFEKMVEGESEMDGEDEDKNGNTIVVRLLVYSSQVGCVLGKAGSVIKQMSSESGALIRVLSKDKLPACASSSDELVQLSGGVDAVRKALHSVSLQLLEHPPRDNDSANPISQSSHSFGNPHSGSEVYPPFPHPAQGAPFAMGPRDGGNGAFGHMGPSQDILTFRLICPDEKVGGVIGKSGTIVKALQHESGCEIKVLDGTPDSDDRVIVISGPAHPNDGISPPQDAVLRVQTRIIRASPETKDKTPTAKIIVYSNQIGCLLGKGGAVIAEMRKSTGAYIRILGKDQLPPYASENEEIVQINGEFDAVHEALLQITTRLRNHFFRDAFPSINHHPNPAFPDHGPPFPSYMGRREHSPPGRYSAYNQFDGVGRLPQHGGFHPHDDHPPFMHNIQRPGFPPHPSERMPPSAPWGPQGPIGPGGPLGFSDYPGVPQRRIGGFGGGAQHAIITNTTVEVVVPRFVVPAIYGEDGGCVKQIREISDAKITITDPKPGATETLIIISGTPEQTHAAQSLIQAFVIIETRLIDLLYPVVGPFAISLLCPDNNESYLGLFSNRLRLADSC